jgi:hypothetical protein
MAIDAKHAEEIASRIARATELCSKSLDVVKRNEGLGQIQVYGRLVGDFMGHSYTNLLAPLWKAFPALEPSEMREPYVEPDATLTPESQEALRAFVMEASAALEFIRTIVPAHEATSFFSYGGMPEVEKAVVEIQEFLAHPRFKDSKGSADAG